MLGNDKGFYAAQKLLTFVLHEVSAQTLSEEEAALQIALRPLITNKDGHFVAAVTSMYQSLLEGKTDCPISGVFGAGKTLSAAAMIAGLLVIMDPSLTIMIVTKENVAAHAFVKHFLRSRRQFWPTLTTRHASLVPVSAEALQRERRQMQAKHLFGWSNLKDKLEVLALRAP